MKTTVGGVKFAYLFASIVSLEQLYVVINWSIS